jgi:hypothetical protein
LGIKKLQKKNMKATVLILALGLSFSVFSCKQEKEKEQPPIVVNEREPEADVKLDSAAYTVLDYDSTSNYLFSQPVTPATLSEAEIRECERVLQGFIDDYNLKQARNVKRSNAGNPKLESIVERYQIKLSDYKRQYMAADHNGEKLVYINCLCQVFVPAPGSESTGWKKQFYQVKDGGKCYFQVLLNLKQKNVLKFSVNGEA